MNDLIDHTKVTAGEIRIDGVNIATAKVEELIDLLKEQFTIIIVTHNHYLFTS